jgi:hypothetical protein
MKNSLIILLLTLSASVFAENDSIEFYTFKTLEDAEAYNIWVNDSNGYPRGGGSGRDAERYAPIEYDSIDYLILLDKVTYKALKDSGIKTKKVKKDKTAAILTDTEDEILRALKK